MRRIVALFPLASAGVSAIVRTIRRSLSVIAVARSLPTRRAAALALVFGLALLAAGCGRKGPLEPPNAGVATPAPTANSDLSEQLGAPKNPPITPPKTSFVLDPLL
jgi:predicted small lipoprotein YifL